MRNTAVGITLEKALEVKKQFIKTGSTLLDLSLGGGILQGRIINIICDESTGKTLLALAIARHIHLKGGWVVYDDAEATLDTVRAAKVFKLNPTETIVRCSETVEDFYKAVLKTCLKSKREKRPALYVLDTLDALGTKMSQVTDADVEKLLNRDRDLEISMRDKLDKSLMMSSVLSLINKKLADSDVTLIIISQTRAKIGVMFGERTDISSGRALKFYASQRLKLAEVGKIVEKVKGNGRRKKIVGINIKAKVIKNKVAEPLQECEFPFYFNTGIDDIGSCVDFLRNNTSLLGKGTSFLYRGKKFKGRKKFILFIMALDKRQDRIRKMVRQVWQKEFKI